jgi:hypothetical protein
MAYLKKIEELLMLLIILSANISSLISLFNTENRNGSQSFFKLFIQRKYYEELKKVQALKQQIKNKGDNNAP